MKHTRFELVHKFAFVVFLAVSVGMLLLLPPTTRAHKFHASFARINYNDQAQTIEITLRLFPDDLENILTRRAGGRHVRLDKTPDAAALTLAYLQSSFELKGRAGRVKRLVWVGMEPQIDAVWIYVEAKVGPAPETLTVRNNILFDLFDDQINLIHMRYKDKKADLVFKPGDNFKNLS